MDSNSMFKALSPVRFFIVVLIYFILLLVISVWSSTYDASIDTSNKETLFTLKIVQAISVIIVFILPACMFVLFFSEEKLHYFLLNKSPSLVFTGLSIVLIFSAMPFITYLEGINRSISLPESLSSIEEWMKMSELKVKEIEEAFLADQTAGDLILNVFVIGFMAALSEELFFRGLFQTAMFKMSKNVHLSVWLTAILFSAFHMQFYGFLPRVVLGALLGYVFVWSGSLWTSIIIHFVNNTLILVLTYMVSTGIVSESVKEIGMESDKVTLVWAIPSFVIVVLGMWFLYKIKKPLPNLS